MGLRGAIRSHPDLKAEGGRVRPAKRPPAAMVEAWEAQAKELGQSGLKLIRLGMAAASKKAGRGRPAKNGPWQFGAGERLLKVADDLWLRLYRIAPMEMPRTGKEPPQPDTLDAFRRKRHEA